MLKSRSCVLLTEFVMSFSGFVVQLLNGLAGASSLFLVAAGLSLIFDVTRIVNFAHGSFFMVGIYVAYSLVGNLGASIGFWPSLLLASPLAAARPFPPYHQTGLACRLA